jgi:hypothetical protein
MANTKIIFYSKNNKLNKLNSINMFKKIQPFYTDKFFNILQDIKFSENNEKRYYIELTITKHYKFKIFPWYTRKKKIIRTESGPIYFGSVEFASNFISANSKNINDDGMFDGILNKLPNILNKKKPDIYKL